MEDTVYFILLSFPHLSAYSAHDSFPKNNKTEVSPNGYVLLSQNRKGRSGPRKRSQRLKAIYILSFCLTRRASKEMFNQKYIVCPLNSEINHWYGKEYTFIHTHTHTRCKMSFFYASLIHKVHFSIN